VYLTIYVDDIVIACADLTILTEIKKRFCERFDMSDMGELEHFLNVRVTRIKNYIQLDQSTYAEKICSIPWTFKQSSQISTTCRCHGQD